MCGHFSRMAYLKIILNVFSMLCAKFFAFTTKPTIFPQICCTIAVRTKEHLWDEPKGSIPVHPKDVLLAILKARVMFQSVAAVCLLLKQLHKK